MVPIPSQINEFSERRRLAIEHTFHHVMLPDLQNFGTALDNGNSIFHLNPTELATPTTFRLKKVEQVDYDLVIALETTWAPVIATLFVISNGVIWLVSILSGKFQF